MASERMTEVKAIKMATKRIELKSGQVFYRTWRAWEIWQGEPDKRRVKRIPRVAVLEVFAKSEE